MSENIETQAFGPESFLQWEDWVVMLTGGLITTGAIGWTVYKGLESQQINYKEIMMISGSFAGGLSIYFASSAIIFKSQKFLKSQRKFKSYEMDESDSIVADYRTSEIMGSRISTPDCRASELDNLLGRVREWKSRYAHDSLDCEYLDKKISNNMIQETVQLLPSFDDITERLNDLNRQRQKNGLPKLTIDQIETCYSEDIESLKMKFKEEIISFISELKGYIQGAIDPLPSARNTRLLSVEMNNECRRLITMIVAEYANSMLPKLEPVIDKFVNSVCEAEKVCSSKEEKSKKVIPILESKEKDESSLSKAEVHQYYSVPKNEPEEIFSFRNNPKISNQSRKALSGSTHLLESGFSHSSQEKDIWPKTSEVQSLPRTSLEIENEAAIRFWSRRESKADTDAAEKPETQNLKPPTKLTLTREQMKYLQILKSEL